MMLFKLNRTVSLSVPCKGLSKSSKIENVSYFEHRFQGRYPHDMRSWKPIVQYVFGNLCLVWMESAKMN